MMDINCINQCFYQTDGKCMLHEIPTYTNSAYNAYDSDCPYFISDTDLWRNNII